MLPDRIEHESLDQGRNRASLLHRAPARVKLIVALVLLAVTAIAQPWWWPVVPGVPLSRIHAAIVVIALAIVVAAGVPWRYLVVRLVAFADPLALVAVTIPLTAGAAGWMIMAGVLAKVILCFTIILSLVYTTPFEQLLHALRQCGAPKLLVAVLAAMHRFIFVLLDELERMRRAQYARTFDCPRRLSAVTIRNGTRAVGMLLVRCSDRAERVHAAMIARGFDGEVRMLEDESS
jgi:cobalt/nickel transport system permease protein